MRRGLRIPSVLRIRCIHSYRLSFRKITFTGTNSMLLAGLQHSVLLICRPGRAVAQLVVKHLWDCGLLEKWPTVSREGIRGHFKPGEILGQVHASLCFALAWHQTTRFAPCKCCPQHDAQSNTECSRCS